MHTPPVQNPEPLRSKPPRTLARKFAMGTGIVIGSILLVLVMITAFFQKQITMKVLNEVGKSLKTEIKLGDVDLSLFSGFPHASVNFKNVRVKDNFGGLLLEAETLSLRFGLFSLFTDNIQINEIVIRDGALNIKIDKNGNANYLILKDSTTPNKKSAPEPNNLKIALENALLQNVALVYDNKMTGQLVQGHVDKAEFAGNFSMSKFTLGSKAQCTLTGIDVDGQRFLAGESVKYDALVMVDLDKSVYGLQALELNLGGNQFDVSGFVAKKPDYTDINLKLDSKEGDVSFLFDLLPGKYHSYFDDFKSTGTYTCAGTVKGRLSKTDKPAIDFQIQLHDAQVSSDKLQSPLKNVSFSASYRARPDGSGALNVDNFKANFGGRPMHLDLKINNFNDPDVRLKFDGTLPLDAAYGLFDNPLITDGSGLVRIQNLLINGKYRDMINMARISNVDATGTLEFQNAGLVYNKTPVTFQSGKLTLADNIFVMEALKLTVKESEFNLGGNAKNLLPVLFADDKNSEDAYLEFGANMYCPKLDVDQIMGLFSVQKTVGDVGKTRFDSLKTAVNENRRQFTDKLKGVFEARIDAFNFKKIEGKNFLGKLAFDHNELIIAGDAEAMRGKIHLDGNAFFVRSPYLKLRITAQQLDLNQCFEQCENFGQEVLKAKNIKGQLSARIAAWAYWDAQGNYQSDKIHVLADLRAERGEIVNLDILKDFATYIHIEDLRHVKFTSLQNFIEIKNRKIYIPAMFIQSNACNFTVSGTHDFDNRIDYKFKVNAGQVLLNRLRNHDNDLDPLPAQNGWFNLYYSIYGTIDKYTMKKDKKGVKADFEEGERRKNRIEVAINEEFKNSGKMPELPDLKTEPDIVSGGGKASEKDEELLDEIEGDGKSSPAKKPGPAKNTGPKPVTTGASKNKPTKTDDDELLDEINGGGR